MMNEMMKEFYTTDIKHSYNQWTKKRMLEVLEKILTPKDYLVLEKISKILGADSMRRKILSFPYGSWKTDSSCKYWVDEFEVRKLLRDWKLGRVKKERPCEVPAVVKNYYER